MSSSSIFFLLFIILLIFVLVSKLRELSALKAAYVKYDGIVSVDAEIAVREQGIVAVEHKIHLLESEYLNKKSLYDDLERSIEIYSESSNLISMGVYEPHFDFGTSDKYKEKILANKEQQKSMVKEGTAINSFGDWAVDGSKQKGKKLVKDSIKLTMRSFNNECDVIIRNTTWKNINTMEERMRKAFDSINKFNESSKITISYEYLSLKVKQLYLAYEYALQLQSEKEHQAELKRQEKEEAELLKEVERIEKEEAKLQKLLEKIEEKARQQVSGEAREKLELEIYQISEELKDLQREHSRVKTMAEQTKYGYVYIISNIGSFGDGVFKIGLTRRVDPMERIRELSAASVPFVFDIHAMVFSENAPALEASLHREFSSKRVNLVNFRKEFFRVSLDEIKHTLSRLDPNIEINENVEAKDYMQTLEIINSRANENQKVLPQFLS